MTITSTMSVPDSAGIQANVHVWKNTESWPKIRWGKVNDAMQVIQKEPYLYGMGQSRPWFGRILLPTVVAVPMVHKTSVLDQSGRTDSVRGFIVLEDQQDPSIQCARSSPSHAESVLGCYILNHQKSLTGS